MQRAVNAKIHEQRYQDKTLITGFDPYQLAENIFIDI